jgi:hypothetical protein
LHLQVVVWCSVESTFWECARRLPIPDYIGLTPASEADINILKEISEDIHLTPVYADKAYIDEALSQLLDQQGSPLNTPVQPFQGSTS